MKKALEATIDRCKVQIIRQAWKQKPLADEMGITTVSLQNKLADPGKFKAVELQLLCHILKVKFPRRLPANMKSFEQHFNDTRTEG